MIGTSGDRRLDCVLRPFFAVFLILPTEASLFVRRRVKRWRDRRLDP